MTWRRCKTMSFAGTPVMISSHLLSLPLFLSLSLSFLLYYMSLCMYVIWRSLNSKEWLCISLYIYCCLSGSPIADGEVPCRSKSCDLSCNFEMIWACRGGYPQIVPSSRANEMQSNLFGSCSWIRPDVQKKNAKIYFFGLCPLYGRQDLRKRQH